jgi:hypothetical protein
MPTTVNDVKIEFVEQRSENSASITGTHPVLDSTFRRTYV